MAVFLEKESWLKNYGQFCQEIDLAVENVFWETVSSQIRASRRTFAARNRFY